MTTNPSTSEVKAKSNNDDTLRQLVCFRLGNEDFGINIGSVHEIIRMITITHIPQAPSFVEGIINLRGKITPVVDLRLRFGFSPAEERNRENRIIVVEAHGHTVGLIVDAVTEVTRLAADKIDRSLELSISNVETLYIEGVSMVGDVLLIILDSERIFTPEEIHSASMSAF